jgi:uncharacterized protein YpmB
MGRRTLKYAPSKDNKFEKTLALIMMIIVLIIIIVSCKLCGNREESQYEKPHTTATIPIDENRQLEIDMDKWNQDVEKYESNTGE